jgi:hypothetical protein
VETPRPKPVTRRRELAIFAVPMVLLAIGANFGNALAPTLITNEPALLLALAPRLRWLLLSSPKVDAVWFYGVPLVRAFGVLSLYYFFGRKYGDAALRWMEIRTGKRALRPVLWIERMFHKGRYGILILFPGTLAALLAGADRMAYSAFIAVAMGSTVVRLVLIRTVAKLFKGTLLDILDWVGNNQMWLTIASFVLVFGWVMWNQREGIEPVASVEELAEEMDEAAAEVADGDPRPER